MKKKLDWKEIGRFLSVLMNVFTIIRDTFKEMKVDIEILSWIITGEGKIFFTENVLRPLGKKWNEEISARSDNFSELRADWQAFYQKLFKKEYDFFKVVIPEKPTEGCWRLLIIADVTLEQLYAKCKEQFPCWRWTDDDLDKKVVWNERDAKKGAYAIWVKDEVEAEEELRNFSANDIEQKGITTETLVERLIHELKFFVETGRHLDIKNVTLCTGSRSAVGSVPGVTLSVGGVFVYWCDPGGADVTLRSRQAVS